MMKNRRRRRSDVHSLRPLSQQGSSSRNRRKTISVQANSRDVRPDDAENINPQYQDANPKSPRSAKKNETKISTPSKRSDAGYYFQNLPKTPLHDMVKSAEKKHHRTPKIDTSYLSNSSDEGDNNSMESSTFDAIEEIKLNLDVNSQSNKGNNKSFNVEATFDSSSSSGSSGSMGRSVLSDTTEMTASNFVFVAKSKQRLLQVQREEKKKNRTQSNNKTTPAGVAHMETSEEHPLSETQKPETISRPEETLQSLQEKTIDYQPKDSAKTDSQNETTLNATPHQKEPSPAKEQALINPFQFKIGNNRGKKSLLTGQSPSNPKNRIQVSPKSLRKFTASLKQTRLQQRQEQDQDLKKRLSMGSAMKPPAPTRPPTTVGIYDDNTVNSRLSLGSAFAAYGPPTGSRADGHDNNKENNRNSSTPDSQFNPFGPFTQRSLQSAQKNEVEKETWENANFRRVGAASPEEVHEEMDFKLSRSLAQSPGEYPAQKINLAMNQEEGGPNDVAAELPMADGVSADQMYDNDDTAEINFEFNEWIRRPLDASGDDDLDSSMRNSNSAAILRRLSNNEPPPTGFNITDETSLNESDETENLDEPPKRQTQVDFSRSPSTRNTSSPDSSKASEDNDASKTDLDALFHDLDTQNNTESPKDNPQEDRDGVEPSSPSSSSTGRLLVTTSHEELSSPSNSHASASSRRTPTSGSKLTPSRLKKRPRRIANPESLLSPAHNTRSATKKKRARLASSVDGSLNQSNHSSGSGLRDLSALADPQNQDPNSSFASSITSRGSRRGSMTADLADLGALFDFANQSRNDEEREESMSTNQRRQTANFSDLDQVLGFLNGDDDEQSTAQVEPNRRRSSMFQSSLASLPENEDTQGRSPSSNRKKRMTGKKSRRRKSSMFLARESINEHEENNSDHGSEAMGSFMQQEDEDPLNESRVDKEGGGVIEGGKSSMIESAIASPNEKDWSASEDTEKEESTDADLQVRVQTKTKETKNAFATGVDSPARNTRFACKKKAEYSSRTEGTIVNSTNGSKESSSPAHKLRNRRRKSDALVHADAVLRNYRPLEAIPDTDAECPLSQGQGSQEEVNDEAARPTDPLSFFERLSQSQVPDEEKNGLINTDKDINSQEPNTAQNKGRTRFSLDSISTDESESVDNSKLSGSSGGRTATLSELGDLLGMANNRKEASPGVKDKGRPRFSLDSVSSDESADNSKHSGSSGGQTATLSDFGDLIGTAFAESSMESGSRASESAESLGLCGQRESEDTQRVQSDEKQIEVKPSTMEVASADESETAFSEREENANSDTASLGDIGNLFGRNSPSSNSSCSSTKNRVAVVERENGVPTTSTKTPLRGVLSSALKKPRNQRDREAEKGSMVKKSVDFKSPEAAEYDIGSMAGTLTPMPSSQARARFTIPRASDDESPSQDMSTSSSPSGISSTSTPSHTPIQSSPVEDKTVALELDMGELMNNVGASSSKPLRGEGETPGTASVSIGNRSQDEATVELESDVHGLLSRAAEQMNSQNQESDDMDTSGEGSLLSVSSGRSSNGGHRPRKNTPANSGGNDSVDSACSSPLSAAPNNGANEDDQTMDLEFNMEAMLGHVGVQPEDSALSHLNVSAIASSSPSEAGTPMQKLDSPHHPKSQTMSSVNTSSSSSSSQSPVKASEDCTVQLERNIMEVLATAEEEKDGGNPSQNDTVQLETDMNEVLAKAYAATDKMMPSQEHTVQLEANMDAVFAQSEQGFVISSQEETVQLENNMQDLLTAGWQRKADDSEADTSPFSSSNRSVQSTTTSFSDSKMEDGTIPQENNLQDLLVNASENASEDLTMRSKQTEYNTPGSLGSKSRRSSVSSHNLSLVPESRLVVSKTGDISIMEDTSITDEQEALVESSTDCSNSDSSHSHGLQPARTTEFDLKGEELLQIALLTFDEKSPLLKLPDIVADFAGFLGGSAPSEFNTLLQAICEELDSKIEDLPDPNETFEEIVDERIDVFAGLQHQLRGAVDASTREEIEYMGQAVNESCQLDWANWLVEVMGSFRSTLSGKLDSMNSELNEINTKIDEIGNAQQMQELVVDTKARRARRKSITRRKAVSATVDDEIKDLKYEISLLEEELSAIKSRDEELNEAQRALTVRVSGRDQMKVLGSQVALAKARSDHLHGMNRWKPAQLTSTLHFQLSASYPESSASLLFNIGGAGSPISCRSKVDLSAYRQKAGVPKKLTKTAANCLKKYTGELLLRSTMSPIQCRTEIGPLMCLLDLRIGRLEQLAVELSDLEKKYTTNITNGKAQFSLEVELSKYVAVFEVKATYPFEPMAIRLDVLEGEVDSRKLKRHLIKEVKPGHGYLSRLCDCMEKYFPN